MMHPGFPLQSFPDAGGNTAMKAMKAGGYRSGQQPGCGGPEAPGKMVSPAYQLPRQLFCRTGNSSLAPRLCREVHHLPASEKF